MPYDIKKSGELYYIYHKGTNNRAVAKGYKTRGEALKVAMARMKYAD